MLADATWSAWEVTMSSHSPPQVGDEVACCYFNDLRYADGAEVLSGSTRLRCERGIWVEVGARKP